MSKSWVDCTHIFQSPHPLTTTRRLFKTLSLELKIVKVWSGYNVIFHLIPIHRAFKLKAIAQCFFETKPVHQIEPNIQFTYMSQYYLRQDNVGRVIILVSRYRTCRSKIITFCLITICVRKVITICVDFFITFCANVITFCGDSYYILR